MSKWIVSTAISISAIIIALSIAYYLTWFLPNKTRAENQMKADQFKIEQEWKIYNAQAKYDQNKK